MGDSESSLVECQITESRVALVCRWGCAKRTMLVEDIFYHSMTVGDNPPPSILLRNDSLVACQVEIDPFIETYVIRQNRLHMRGILLDSISEITDGIQMSASAASLFDLFRLAFHQDPFLTGHTHLESLMRTICAGIVEEEHKSVSRDDTFEWFARWFRIVSHNPTHLARLRESFDKVDSQDWDRFWMFGPSYLDKESLLPSPNDQNTASAEAETWSQSTELTRFLDGFMEGEIFSRNKAGGLDVKIESVVLI